MLKKELGLHTWAELLYKFTLLLRSVIFIFLEEI